METMSISKDEPKRPGRRHFLKTIATFSASAASLVAGQRHPTPMALGPGALDPHSPITEVFMDLNHIHKWDHSNGDTWDLFWADDGSLYAFNCDGRGFGTKRRNLAFNHLEGDHPHSLVGHIVNSMDEYGTAGQKEADNATWKACGQECIDSVFYAFVSRNLYGRDSGDPLMRQTAANASLIKSLDRGRTWTRSAAENYKKPMWPGRRFGAPLFVHYGQNGGHVTRDEADRSVYALSTNGFWNDGDSYFLGRVERKKLPDLNSSDWTYYSGGGSQDSVKWSGEIERAVPVLSLPAKCGQTPPCYIHLLETYLMVVWYNTPKLTEWFKPQKMIYQFYQAPHPWGPWSFINSHSDRFISDGHMYGPSLCAKFQEKRGSDVIVSLFTSGCPFQDVPSGLYKIWEIPLVLKTNLQEASTIVNDGDPRISYSGSWRPIVRPGSFDYHEDVHQTASANDSLEFTFTGTGIDYIAEKSPDFGDVHVYLDSALNQNVSLRLVNFPRIYRAQVFSVKGLPLGRHTIKIVNKSNQPVVVDAFRIYGSKEG
jgi:hypothetical protein